MTNSKATSNTKAATSGTTSEATSEAWEMALSVVAALEQTYQKAKEEHQAAQDAAKGQPFGKGITSSRHLLMALSDARDTLKTDLRTFARSSGRSLCKEAY